MSTWQGIESCPRDELVFFWIPNGVSGFKYHFCWLGLKSICDDPPAPPYETFSVISPMGDLDGGYPQVVLVDFYSAGPPEPIQPSHWMRLPSPP